MLFCHAVPSSDDPIFTRITPDDDVVELVGRTDANVLVVGHTHVQFDRMLPTGLRVVNAGSVGMPYEGRRGAFWALLGPDVELRRPEYDVEAAAALVRESAPRARRPRPPAPRSAEPGRGDVVLRVGPWRVATSARLGAAGSAAGASASARSSSGWPRSTPTRRSRSASVRTSSCSCR